MDSAFTQHSRLCCRYFRYNDAFVVQSPSCVRLFVTPWTAACQASFSLSISRSLPKFMSIVLVMPPSHLILWHRLLLLPSSFLSIQVFSKDSAVHISWPKYWNLSFSISPSNEYSVLISSKIDWFDLLTAQGTLRSLLQHHNLKVTILWCSAFFIIQLSELCMTTGKTIALILWIFVSSHVSAFQYMVYVCLNFFVKKEMSSDFMAAATICSHFRAKEEEIYHFFHLFLFYLPWSNGVRCHNLSFLRDKTQIHVSAYRPCEETCKSSVPTSSTRGPEINSKRNYDPIVCRKETKNTINRTKWNDRKICCR